MLVLQDTKTTIKTNIIYCTKEISGDKYSMNDSTRVQPSNSKQFTVDVLR